MQTLSASRQNAFSRYCRDVHAHNGFALANLYTCATLPFCLGRRVHDARASVTVRIPKSSTSSCSFHCQRTCVRGGRGPYLRRLRIGTSDVTHASCSWRRCPSMSPRHAYETWHTKLAQETAGNDVPISSGWIRKRRSSRGACAALFSCVCVGRG